MRRATVAGLASLLLLAAPARPAAAYEINEQLTVFGYSQLWFTLYEQMEEAEGLNQHPSGDAAAASASGLSLRRARLGARAALFDGALRLFTQFKLEGDPGFTDAVISLHLQKNRPNPLVWKTVFFRNGPGFPRDRSYSSGKKSCCSLFFRDWV